MFLTYTYNTYVPMYTFNGFHKYLIISYQNNVGDPDLAINRTTTKYGMSYLVCIDYSTVTFMTKNNLYFNNYNVVTSIKLIWRR